MTYEEKKRLYEDIMQQIAPIVKRQINEFSSKLNVMFYKEFQKLDEFLEKNNERIQSFVSSLS